METVGKVGNGRDGLGPFGILKLKILMILVELILKYAWLMNKTILFFF